MPPTKKARTIGSEKTLAQRISHERQRREWTYDQVARRMTDVGCPMQASAILKIEKGEKGGPQRRITVDELVAFSKVFAVPMDELLIPISRALDDEARRLVKEWMAAMDDARAAISAELAARDAVILHTSDHPDSRDASVAALRAYYPAGRVSSASAASQLAYYESLLRGVPQEDADFQAWLEAVQRDQAETGS